jgi:hypothetical protein
MVFQRLNRIEFRRGTTTPAWGAGNDVSTVDVLIDGACLKTLWQEATGTDHQSLLAHGLSNDLEMWGPYSTGATDSYRRDVPSGFVPVLTCSCTTFGCGGVYARITFTPTTATWRDFRRVRRTETSPVGPFVFDRQQYEDARRAFLDEGA